MYLSGSKHPAIAADLAEGTIGLLATPATRYTLDGVAVWAADNGAYTGRYPGDDLFLAWLGRLAAHRPRCLFVAAPDVVADAEATLSRLPAMADRLRMAGWPVALVGQDGMERLEVPWHLFDWLFVGGTTDWKLGAGGVSLIRRAQAAGKRVHVGRVNTRRRYWLFRGLGCDSADGTSIAYGPDVNAARLRDWMAESVQGVMW